MTEEKQDDIYKIPTTAEVNNFIVEKVNEIRFLMEQSSGVVVKRLNIDASSDFGVRVVVTPWMTAELPNMNNRRIN